MLTHPSRSHSQWLCGAALLGPLLLVGHAAADADPPRLVPPLQIERDRLAGDAPRLPPAVRAAQRGQPLNGAYKLCLDRRGVVTSVTPIAGIPGADEAITATLQKWTFKEQLQPLCYIKGLSFEPAEARPSFLLPERYVLPNGLRVLLHRDARLPIVAVHVNYHVGAGAEAPGLTGTAHLAEHLFDEGTPSDYEYYLGSLGSNASTDFDRTADYIVVSSSNLAGALAVQGQHMMLIRDRARFPNVNDERRVVKNERMQRLTSQPFGVPEERLWHALFPGDHPYHGMVIGTAADLERITATDVRAFCVQRFGPRSATLALVGDFDPPEARRLIDKYFGTLPAEPAEGWQAATPPPARLSAEVRLHHGETVARHSRLSIAWHTPGAGTPADAAARLLGEILSGGRGARLQRRFEPLLGRVLNLSASQRSLRFQSVFQIDVDATARTDLAPLLGEVDAVLQALRQAGPGEDELVAARATLRNRRLLQADGALSRADLLQHYQLYAGDADGLGAELLRLEDTGPDDIRRLLEEHLLPNRRVVMFAEREEVGP